VVRPGATAVRGVSTAIRRGVGGVELSGTLRMPDRYIDLTAVFGVYVRPVDPELMPELSGRAPDAPDLVHARRVHDALAGFTEAAPRLTGCRVANRLSAMASNTSKPYQAQAVVRHGFATPETLISDDPDEVLAFVDTYREVIYKSSSGVRSVVTSFDPTTDPQRLHRVRWCPVQFQERINGPDVRVHVVGGEVFAAMVDSGAVDYRYARMQVGADARLTPYRLTDDVAERCVGLAADLDLPFAGIDLKFATDGRVICFEVNPSPGFSWYETETGLPIAAALARWLLHN
jgi:glutathione synthase/RimK-type ligase-like ATP-grasp enzyme